jgi:hypothetical protein
MFNYRNDSNRISVLRNTSEVISIKHLAPFAKHLNTQVCPTFMRPLTRKEKVKFLTNGNLLVDNETYFQIYESGFCIENFLISAANNKSHLFMSAFLCKNQKPIVAQKVSDNYIVDFDLDAMNQRLRFWLTISGFLSIFFLLLTFLFYLTLPELRNFQGRIVCVYILSIVLKTSLLIVIYNVKLDLSEEEETESREEFFILISETVCLTIGYSLYFSGILMFCWMSVLCFDLFWTFVCTPIQLQNKKNTFRLFLYFAIGFGVPTLMTLSIYLLDRFRMFDVSPDVGLDRCFLSFNGARYFFNVPIMILLAFNTIIFIITTISLWKSIRENKMASMQQSSQRVNVFFNF